MFNNIKNKFSVLTTFKKVKVVSIVCTFTLLLILVMTSKVLFLYAMTVALLIYFVCWLIDTVTTFRSWLNDRKKGFKQQFNEVRALTTEMQEKYKKHKEKSE